MNKNLVPVTYSISETVEIKANDLSEINFRTLKLPENPEYIDDSFNVEFSDIE